MSVDFIGIGAQKSGTSWIHACLFEHPEICSPVKEIHFFSRDRYSKGIVWYEENFSSCSIDSKRGEFSTSYLYSEKTAERITEVYPNVKIIAVLREPVARAYSQYRNAIKAGEITEIITFDSYIETEKSCMEQGLYAMQLRRYFDSFSKEQVLVLVYEDIKKDSQTFIQKIYNHIGVDSSFVPPSLESQINIARIPKNIKVDSAMHTVAELLRRHDFSSLVHAIKRSGVTDMIRSVNSKEEQKKEVDLSRYKKYFAHDVQDLSNLLGKDLVKQWKYNEA